MPIIYTTRFGPPTTTTTTTRAFLGPAASPQVKRKGKKEQPTSASALHSCGGGGGGEMEKKKKKVFFPLPLFWENAVSARRCGQFFRLSSGHHQKDTSRVLLLLEVAVEEEVGIGSLQDFLFPSSSFPKFCHGNFPSLFPSVFSCGAKCESCHEGKRKKRRHLFSLFGGRFFLLLSNDEKLSCL